MTSDDDVCSERQPPAGQPAQSPFYTLGRMMRVYADIYAVRPKPRELHDPAAHERLAQRIEAEGYRILRDWASAEAWANEHFLPWYHSLSWNAQASLDRYRIVSTAMNFGLRDAPIPANANYREFREQLDALFVKARAPEKIAVHREFNMFLMRATSRRWQAVLDALKPGDVLTDKAYLSASLRWDWRGIYSGDHWRGSAVILLDTGAPLLPVRRFHTPNWTGSSEVLLPRDLPLRVVERPTTDNNYRFIMDVAS